MKQCSQLASWGKLFLDLLKQGFLPRGAGLMNEKLDICGRDDLFFIHGLLHKRLSFLTNCALATICAHTDYKKFEGTLLIGNQFFSSSEGLKVRSH